MLWLCCDTLPQYDKGFEQVHSGTQSTHPLIYPHCTAHMHTKCSPGHAQVLPDAVTALTNPCLELSGEYPWAYVFAGTFALITLTLEMALRGYIFKCVQGSGFRIQGFTPNSLSHTRKHLVSGLL